MNKNLRLKYEEEDWRSPFAIDRDRILYSGAYKRCSGKTQVVYFSSQHDEQLSNRMVHIQYVSQICRTIGACCNLNLDLLEASALGHDLGHPPFGHDGETFLNALCQEHNIGQFLHNIHSLYIVDKFSYHGKGMNLTWPVRNAIAAHNGEKNLSKITPDKKFTPSELDTVTKTPIIYKTIKPATQEACLLFFSDTIAYIGTDIEDAIRLKLINRRELPAICTKILGNNNGSIIKTLVNNLINNFRISGYFYFSAEVADALFKLKRFNYERIYNNSKLKSEKDKIRKGFSILFETYLDDLRKENKNSDIYNHFLSGKNENYRNNQHPVIVRDFIASMTDRYFKFQLEKIIVPKT